MILVLDDYHVIRERSCHDQLASLLFHLPPSLQLVLITRADPRLPLARLRTIGEMVEIRMPELRFTPLQAAALVHAVSGAELTAADLADLVERTEGWPAGIYLAALSLRGHPDPGAFVRQFTGNNRFVVDFLAEEVLSRQPATIRQFLARTSILDRFCAPLCDAVVGSDNAADILDLLERENLFVVPLDDTRRWYRYHHLFAQVLTSQLARDEPGTVPVLHQRASAWYTASGWVDEAIGHVLAAGDIPRSVELIARNWYAYVSVGRAGTVRAWMRLFTDDQIAAYPLAAHCAAWAAALSGEPEPLRRWLPVIEASRYAGQMPDGLVSMESSAALLRGVYGFDGLPVMRESARHATGLETDPRSPWYTLARAAYGFSLYLSGDLEAAEAELEDAARSEACATLIGILALSTLSLIAVERGDIPRAEGLADIARGLATRDDLSEAPQASLAYTATGRVRAAQGRLARGAGRIRACGLVPAAQAGDEPVGHPGRHPLAGPGAPRPGGERGGRRADRRRPERAVGVPRGRGGPPGPAGSPPAAARGPAPGGGLPGQHAHRARGGGAAPPPGHDVPAGNQRGTVRVPEHGEDPRPGDLPQAGRVQPAGRRAARA